jgi:hypothetical protein
MIFVLLGLAVGLAVAVGPLGFLQSPVDRLTNDLVLAVDRPINRVLADVHLSRHHQSLAASLAVLVATLTPGITAVLLAELAHASKKARQLASALLVAGALGSFFVLSTGGATGLLGAAVVLALASRVLTGAVLTTPLVALVTIIGARYLALLWHHSSSVVQSGATTLAVSTHTPTHLEVWQVALTVLALIPFLVAAKVVVKAA